MELYFAFKAATIFVLGQLCGVCLYKGWTRGFKNRYVYTGVAAICGAAFTAVSLALGW